MTPNDVIKAYQSHPHARSQFVYREDNTLDYILTELYKMRIPCHRELIIRNLLKNGCHNIVLQHFDDCSYIKANIETPNNILADTSMEASAYNWNDRTKTITIFIKEK